jgi:chromatin segregation and condensation protein Rec8/ScpA/Scc1 (kleisin family)
LEEILKLRPKDRGRFISENEEILNSEDYIKWRDKSELTEEEKLRKFKVKLRKIRKKRRKKQQEIVERDVHLISKRKIKRMTSEVYRMTVEGGNAKSNEKKFNEGEEIWKLIHCIKFMVEYGLNIEV